MSARRKLNGAYWNGSMLVAGTFGLLTQSWAVFGVALAGLLVSNWWSGNFRTGRKS